MKNTRALVFAIAIGIGHALGGNALAQEPDYVIHLANDDDTDGILIEVVDSGLDTDTGDAGDDFSVGVPSSGNFADLFLVVPNPNSIPPINGFRIDLPNHSSEFSVVLWEDVDGDGLYGEGVDGVLDAGVTDFNGYFSLEYPNNFDGSAGILIYLGDEFDNGDTITGCVGCSS